MTFACSQHAIATGALPASKSGIYRHSREDACEFIPQETCREALLPFIPPSCCRRFVRTEAAPPARCRHQLRAKKTSEKDGVTP